MEILQVKNTVLRKRKQKWMGSTPNGNNRRKLSEFEDRPINIIESEKEKILRKNMYRV